jgi:hypothetical protein
MMNQASILMDHLWPCLVQPQKQRTNRSQPNRIKDHLKRAQKHLSNKKKDTHDDTKDKRVPIVASLQIDSTPLLISLSQAHTRSSTFACTRKRAFSRLLLCTFRSTEFAFVSKQQAAAKIPFNDENSAHTQKTSRLTSREYVALFWCVLADGWKKRMERHAGAHERE